MSAPLGRLRAPWVDLPLFGLPLACEPVRALSDLVEQLGSLVEAMCSTDVMANYTSREDLRATVAKALEHNVRTSDGMNWNLQDLVYEALSEEWRKRDGEDDDPWENHGPDGYQPPSDGLI